MAFHAVAEDLMEEDAGGASGEDRGADEGLGFGAISRLVTSLATRSTAAFSVLSSGRPEEFTASKVSNELKSVPSEALAEAVITTRANPRPNCRREPSVLTK
jgi:hypothetical protein